MMKVIMINGKKRSGKDTTATELQKALYSDGDGVVAEIKSFATPMKNIVATTLGVSLDDLEEFKNNPTDYKLLTITKEFGPEVIIRETDYRQVLQNFGTEAMKPVFGEHVWASLMIQEINKLSVLGVDAVIIPDFRFKEEFDAMIFADFDIVTIQVQDSTIVSSDTHASETYEHKCDFVIDNTVKDLEALKTKVNRIARTILNDKD